MKITDGLLNAKRPKPATPKPSPDGFQWPAQRDPDAVEIGKKLAASLQELLPEKGWKHVDLSRALWGTMGPNDTPRNVGPARRWVLAELPIPNEETAAYIAQVLDVPMARLLNPKGKFNPKPDMVRERSPNGVNKWKQKGAAAMKKVKAKAKAKAKTDMRGKWKRPKQAATPVRKYVKRALNGHAAGDGGPVWKLAEGVKPPEYTITSAEGHDGHVDLNLKGTMPLERAMAILHMLKHEEATE